MQKFSKGIYSEQSQYGNIWNLRGSLELQENLNSALTVCLRLKVLRVLLSNC